MEFKNFPLTSVGNTVGLVGGVWSEEGKVYLCLFPEYNGDHDHDAPEYVEMNGDDWARLLRQSDLLETEVLSRCEDGKLYKAIARKCQRNIGQKVSWAVFKRDHYSCRYCGNDDVPLTVDHLVLWEDGGPSTEENLVAACKKCNKTRGNMKYADWLRSPYYRKVADKTTQSRRQLNADVLLTLDSIEPVINIRSKR